MVFWMSAVFNPYQPCPHKKSSVRSCTYTRSNNMKPTLYTPTLCACQELFRFFHYGDLTRKDIRPSLKQFSPRRFAPANEPGRSETREQIQRPRLASLDCVSPKQDRDRLQIRRTYPTASEDCGCEFHRPSAIFPPQGGTIAA